MSNTATSSYDRAHTQDLMDQHLDIETALLRVSLIETEAIRKITHHFKLVAKQIEMILSDIPTSIIVDGTSIPIRDTNKTDALKNQIKQLTVLDLPDITPELERDISINVFAHNIVNANWVHFPHLASIAETTPTYLAAVTQQAAAAARAVTEMYWKHVQGDQIVNLLGEQGYAWEFIDPNGEVEKVMEQDNLTAVQARAKIMQIGVDLLYDKTIYRREGSSYVTTWHTMVMSLGLAQHRENVLKDTNFLGTLGDKDPSRFPTPEPAEEDSA